MHHEEGTAGENKSCIDLAEAINWRIGEQLIVCTSPGMIFKASGIDGLHANGTIVFGRARCETETKSIIHKAISQIKRAGAVLYHGILKHIVEINGGVVLIKPGLVGLVANTCEGVKRNLFIFQYIVPDIERNPEIADSAASFVTVAAHAAASHQ